MHINGTVVFYPDYAVFILTDYIISKKKDIKTVSFLNLFLSSNIFKTFKSVGEAIKVAIYLFRIYVAVTEAMTNYHLKIIES